MASIRDFLGELKQRNVVRVCGVYAVTTWGVFQICNNLFPVLSLPKWTLTLCAVLMLVGFPIAAVMAWALEKGPSGVRLTGGVRPGVRADYHLTDWLLIAAMVGVVAITGAQMAGLTGRRVLSAGAGGEGGAAAASRSIAVLPFVSFSEGKDADFFADGLTEEVINSLAQMPQLQVAGRTSAFYFKGRNTDLREVGRKLGVAHVIEGSVRRQGDRVRVTVQLINVATGFHMWSQTYDRTLDDALALQTEIANTVAGVLKTRLLATGAKPAARQASAGEAYRLALVGRARLRAATQGDTAAARDVFRRLIAIAPNDAAGYAGYAHATVLLAQEYSALDFAPAMNEAADNIGKSLALDPRNAEAWIARGLLNTAQNRRTSNDRYLATAEGAFTRAIQIEPRNPDAQLFYANLLLLTGRDAEAIGVLQKVTRVDPLNRRALYLYAEALVDAGRAAEAARQYRTLIDLYPDYVDAKTELATLSVEQGRLDLAEPWLKAAAATGDISARLKLSLLYLNLGMKPQAQAVLMAVKSEPALSIGQVAWMMGSGDYASVAPFSRVKLQQTQDPFWHEGIVAGLLMTGDNAGGLAAARQANPELFTPEPQVSAQALNSALDAAWFLQATGDVAQARKIIARVLALTTPKPGRIRYGSVRVARIEAYAMLGDKAHAVAELTDAVQNGYRSLYDVDHFVRLDQLPQLRQLQADPDFHAQITAIDADNARMRERVLAAH